MNLVWHDLGDGRMALRAARPPRPRRRSGFPCPMVLRDGFDAPVQSMANGRWYDSKRALAASHRASGNPHGQDFVELGEEVPKAPPPEPDAARRRDDIREALADIKAGRLPDVLTLDD